LLGYDIHYHCPPVERLPVHLPLQNIVKLHKNSKFKSIIEDHKYKSTELIQWFEANKMYDNARNVTYCDFPKSWRWDTTKKKWVKREQGFTISDANYLQRQKKEYKLLNIQLQCSI
jgi:ADP-glucose pyrophosphorylase